ncbi:MAG: hypothetical protein DRQ78_04915 [Epsilonproteobacteria bacterium]|nr:MAG: hypothetical protein DRQ78_04915 [Campylobacterota bacterium]
MGFADDVTNLRNNMDVLINAQKKFTDNKLDAIEKASKFTQKELKTFVAVATEVLTKYNSIQQVRDGLDSINKLVSIQNQVQYASDNRDVISAVAGSLDDIKAVNALGHSICKVSGMEPTLTTLVKMKDDIELVLENKDKIDATNQLAEDIRLDMAKLKKMSAEMSSNLVEMRSLHASMAELNKDTATHARIASFAHKQLQDFQVKTFIIEPDRKGYSKYESKENTLNLFVPQGKEGKEGEKGDDGRRGQRGVPGTAVEKGDTGDVGQSGRNGQNFRIDLFGNKREMARFGNRAIGTSFLSLDESPVMIYFRNSNTLDSWTKGQPFGISEGETANITVTDSQKIGGYTIEQIMSHIQNMVEKRMEQDGSTS